MLKLPKFLYAAEDVPAGGGAPASFDKEAMVEFLKGEGEKDEPLELPKDDETKEDDDKDDKTDKTKEKEVKEDDDKTDDDEDKDEDDDEELEALVEDLEDIPEEKLELTTPVSRREILKVYPDLFKKFPYLETAYYREQQFTEVHATPKEAKESRAKAESLDMFENDLMDGNIEKVLSSVKDLDTNSFHKVIDNLLPTLQKVDNEAYLHVLSNVTRHLVKQLSTAARSQKIEAYESAAKVINQFLFGTTEYDEPTKLAKDVPKDDREEKISQREREFVQRQFDTARVDLNTRVTNSIRATIEQNIDKPGTMSEYVRKAAVREANEQVEKLLVGDKRLKDITDRLWQDAFKKNFSQDSVAKIRKAYVSKALTLLPTVIKQARNEALRGMGKRVRESEDKERPRGPVRKEQPRSQSSGRIKDAKDIPKGMSTLEFLNSDD